MVLSSNLERNNKKKQSVRVIRCFVCNKIKHIAKNCFKGFRAQKGVKKCYSCKPGHLSANCRFKKNKDKKKKLSMMRRIEIRW